MKRNRVSLVAILVAITPLLVMAQADRPATSKKRTPNAPVAHRAQPPTDKGPSQAATQRWIASEMPALTAHTYEEERGGVGVVTHSVVWSKVTQALFRDDCTLSFRNEIGFVTADADRWSKAYDVAVPLRDVDAGSISVTQHPIIFAKTIRTGDAYEVSVRLKASAGKTIVSTEVGTDDSRLEALQTIPVIDVPSGERVANALRRAATLCGAGSSAF